jgi:hypothetical protein
LKVFYLCDLGVSSAKDPRFGMPLQWDIPLLEGYAYQFIPNRASKPGNSHFFGYFNPGLASNLAAWRPRRHSADELCLSHLRSTSS